MQQPRHPQTNIIRDNPTTFGPIVLGPQGSRRIPLGRYRETDPEPHFDITYKPAVPGTVTHELIKLPVDEAGTYVLTGHFQSFSDKPVTVTVCRQQ